MFDSPIDYCPICKEMVLLDQTHRECAAGHQCRKSVVCPLDAYFSGYDFSSPKPARDRIPNESKH